MKRLGVVYCLILVVACVSQCTPKEPMPNDLAATSQPQTTAPAQITLDLGKGASMQLRLIPAGSFVMGSTSGEVGRDSDEGPTRQVRISRPFYMGVTEVTQRQYEGVMGENPSLFSDEQNPVEGVWWEQAIEFCRRASEITGRKVRLPTEAEWEFSCRSGSTTMFSFGDAVSDLGLYGNYCDRAESSYPPAIKAMEGGDRYRPQPVASLKPNAWGLYDMHGNVFEWCSDFYRDSYSELTDTDPQGASSGAYRVLRGGSWASPSWQCRSAYRHRFTADGRFNNLIGFRVVVEVK